jgi:hypothetical protein
MKRNVTISTLLWLSAMGFIIVGALLWLIIWQDHGHDTTSAGAINSPPIFAMPTNTTTAAVIPPVLTNATNPSASARLPVRMFSWFRPHPFPVSKSSGAFEWTAEDGKDTNVIRQLAHNELEYQRMVAENATIFRRQLVYHPEGFTLQAQQAAQSGQSIQQITLPGLDGQVLQVNVTKTDFESGGDKGLFYGKLPGEPDSMVTAAFINGREAFTVVSPQEHLFLQAETREPGEIVVKSIDPKTYGGAAD